MTKDAPLMTPNQQRSIYQVPTAQRATNSTNRQMVWGTGTYGYSTADLSMFYSKYDVAGNVSSVSMLGYQGNPNGANWGEATLDVQYISSVGLGVATVVANTDNATSSESSGGFGPGFLEFAAALANDPKPPHVVSLRYDCARTRTHSRTAPLALALPLPLPNANCTWLIDWWVLCLFCSLGSLAWDSCDLLCRQAALMGSSSYNSCITYVQAQFQVCMVCVPATNN
jgi:hypothetical protein